MSTIKRLLKFIFIDSAFNLIFNVIFAQNFKFIKPIEFRLKDYQENQIIRGAFVGLSIIAVLQISVVNPISVLLRLSTLFFVFSIFTLGLAFVMEFFLISTSDKIKIPTMNNLLNYIGVITTIIAIILILFHISIIIGIISVFLFVVGLYLLIVFILFGVIYNFDEIYEKLSRISDRDERSEILSYRNRMRLFSNLFTWMEDQKFKSISNQGGLTIEETATIMVDLNNNDHMNYLFHIWELRCEGKISDGEYNTLKGLFVRGLRDIHAIELLVDILKDESSVKEKLKDM